MRTRFAILAFNIVLGCLLNSSYGQFSREVAKPSSIAPDTSRKISVGRTDRTIRIVPRAKDLDPDIGGTFIDLGFVTNVTANTLVTLNKLGGPLPPGTESFKWTPAGEHHRVQFLNLEANTDYKIQIDLWPTVPTDGPAPLTTELTFTTLKRHVFVALDDVYVYDDADWHSAGDLHFGVQIGDESADFKQPGNSWDFLSFKTNMHSGTSLNLPETGKPNYLYQNNVQSTAMKIAVTAHENDHAPGHFAFRPTPIDNYLGSGQDAYNEWNSGYKVFDIGHSFLTPDANNLHQQEALVREFEIHVAPTSDADLSYSLSGLLVVAYW